MGLGPGRSWAGGAAQPRGCAPHASLHPTVRRDWGKGICAPAIWGHRCGRDGKGCDGLVSSWGCPDPSHRSPHGSAKGTNIRGHPVPGWGLIGPLAHTRGVIKDQVGGVPAVLHPLPWQFRGCYLRYRAPGQEGPPGMPREFPRAAGESAGPGALRAEVCQRVPSWEAARARLCCAGAAAALPGDAGVQQPRAKRTSHLGTP